MVCAWKVKVLFCLFFYLFAIFYNKFFFSKNTFKWMSMGMGKRMGNGCEDKSEQIKKVKLGKPKEGEGGPRAEEAGETWGRRKSGQWRAHSPHPSPVPLGEPTHGTELLDPWR